jgi:hypothetical protein
MLPAEGRTSSAAHIRDNGADVIDLGCIRGNVATPGHYAAARARDRISIDVLTRGSCAAVRPGQNGPQLNSTNSLGRGP